MKQEEITSYVGKNQVTIVKSENCSYIPIHLAKDSYKVVIATFESFIGQRYKYLEKDENVKTAIYTQMSNDISEDYQIACISYGRRLIEEIFKNKDDQKFVLIIDDSYNCVNADLLLGFATYLFGEKAQFRLVIINKIQKYNGKLSTFFKDAPVVELDPLKKSYPVSFYYHPDSNLEEIILSVYKKYFCNNTLVILEKGEINELRKKLELYFEANGVSPIARPVIICLNNNSDCCREIPYNRKLIILTTYYSSQIALSKFNINAVIDRGLEQNWDMLHASQALVLRNVSKATIDERKSLASGHRHGEYHLCSRVDYDSRKEVNTRVEEDFDNMILTLISLLNINVQTLNFFYADTRYVISCFLKKLYLLDCITGKSKEITAIGEEVLKLGIDIRFSRIIIEARKYNLEFDSFLCYLLKKFGDLWLYDETTDSICTGDKKSDLFAQMLTLKKVYFGEIDPNKYDLKKRKRCKDVINRYSSMINIKPSKYSNISDMKKCIACGFPDYLFIATTRKGYQNDASTKYYYNTANASTVRLNENMYIVGISLSYNKVRNYLSGRIHLVTGYTEEEVMECYSEYLQFSYFTTDGRNVFGQYTYNDMKVKIEFIGTVDDLKISCPEAFHEEKEIDEVSGKNVICLYFHDLKISSKPCFKAI